MKTVKLGAGMAFWGDSVRPAIEMVERADIDYLCCDHLAGEIAVAMTDRMVARGQLELSPDGGALTGAGAEFLCDLGVDLDTEAGRGSRRRTAPMFCRPCLDWSERRPHIAGALGAAICRCCLAKGWIRRVEGTRAVTVTRAGELALGRAFDLRPGG